ncbi:MAG: DUF4199 domain-containing protein [Bacteroidota bacterium]
MLNKPEIRYSFIYGLLGGFCCFLFLIFLQNMLNINPLGGKKETGIVFLIIAMILAVRTVRQKNGGAIDFKVGYGICFLTTIIASLTSVALLFVFLEYISINCLAEYVETTTKDLLKNRDQIIKNGIAEMAYNDALANIKITNVKSILMDDFIKKIFLSIIPSLMISLYFRRRFIS